MKKASMIIAMAALIVFATAGTALANFGPHGGYALDTDACAGCHRAHTSFSDLSWSDNAGNDHSALLVSSATSMMEFCYACHGDSAPGASTNVESGVFDSGPSSSGGAAPAGSVLYKTNSTFLATLNGGLFGSGSTSMHDMDKGAVTDPMWGAGSSAVGGTNLSCTGCHDVHGSSNYRLLKDTVNGKTVGGYNASDTPQPFVFSSEEGYPAVGWRKHDPGAAQMAGYVPNYTTAEYQWQSSVGYSGANVRSMSTWCSACHESYNRTTGSYRADGSYNATGTYDYGNFESDGKFSRGVDGSLTVTNVTNVVGAQVRHRHPVDVPVSAAEADDASDPWDVGTGFAHDTVTSTVLPLEKRPTATEPRGTWTRDDFLGCLTCHRAHGTSSVMTGWAQAKLVSFPTSTGIGWSVAPTTSVPGGVNPNFTSALLRTNNRGVCERCHNK